MKPLLRCGGVGTKMWPASRQSMPKHFLPLINGKSLFEINYESMKKKFEISDIYVQTTESQLELVKKNAPDLPIENIFLEPDLRNHGPATGLAAALLYKKGFVDEPFMLIQTDVLRTPVSELFNMMDVCNELAKIDSRYITSGLNFDYGVMGVDYLKLGNLEIDKNGVRVYGVKAYLPRGDKQTADNYVKEGALVHTNHTCMTPRNFLEMYKKYKMEWYEPLMRIVEGASIDKEYAKMPKGPIEEVTSLVHADGGSLVVDSPFEWMDFGTWESLDKYLGKDVANHDSPVQNIFEIDSKNNFIKAKKGKFVATIGVDNLVVVDTDDALLICRKDQSGRVGEVVEYLKTKNPDLL